MNLPLCLSINQKVRNLTPSTTTVVIVVDDDDDVDAAVAAITISIFSNLLSVLISYRLDELAETLTSPD